MIRFVIRNKATGQFLSTRPTGGSRQWVSSLDKAALYRRRCDVSNSFNHLPEVKQWLKDNNRRYTPSWSLIPSSFPVDVVEFTVLLIDNEKGYLTKSAVEEWLS